MDTGLLTALAGGIVGGFVSQLLAHVFQSRRSRRDRRREWCREVRALAKRVETQARALDATEPVGPNVRSKPPEEAESDAVGRILSDVEKLRQKRYSAPVSLDDSAVKRALENLTRTYPRDPTADERVSTSELKRELTDEAKSVVDEVEEAYPEPLRRRLSNRLL